MVLWFYYVFITRNNIPKQTGHAFGGSGGVPTAQNVFYFMHFIENFAKSYVGTLEGRHPLDPPLHTPFNEDAHMLYLGAYSSFTLKLKILYFDAYTSLFLSVFAANL